MTLDDFLFDKRTVERHLKEGRLSAADHQRMLATLPDRSDNVVRSAEPRPQAPAQETPAAALEPAAQPADTRPAPRPDPGVAFDAPPV